MTTALVSYEYPGVTANCGGGGRVVETLAERLRARGTPPQVITDIADGHYATSPPRLFRHLQRQPTPDVVHAAFSVPSGLAAGYYCSQSDVPLVVTVMGADIYDPTRYRYLAPLRDRLNRWVFDHADAVVAPSTDMQRRVESNYDVDCRLIHHGIDADDWPWQRREAHDPLRVLTVARQVARKNLDTACRATATLASRGRAVRHRLVGTGPDGDSLRRRWGDSGVHQFVGYVEELREAYAWADLFLLPSLHEAFGLVVAEALASGLPVVTSATGGQTDLVTDAVGETVSVDGADAPAGLADAVARVAADYESYQTATERYISRVFSAASMTDAYTDLYREVTDGKRASPPLRA